MTRDDSMLSQRSFIILLALALWLGQFYRFSELGHRPMHTDEAILAMKTIEFWKSSHFIYDPHDFHGPALHYLTRAAGSLCGWKVESLDEIKLRWVVALCGMALVAGVLIISDGLERGGTLCAALLTAVSPMMVYYNRYFIMESLFVLLLFLFIASLWRWTQSRNAFWLIAGGISLGLLHATKETFVLNLVALSAGWLLVKMLELKFKKTTQRLSLGRNIDKTSMPLVIALVLVPAVLVSATLYSSFFTDWQGMKDSVLTYKNYFTRSGGSGHEKPWHYYLTLLFFRKDGFIWTESLIGGLAMVGVFNAWTNLRIEEHKRALILLLGGYAVASLIIYSVIPYKTPWSILATQHAFILLAGFGASTLIGTMKERVPRVILIVLFAAGLWHLCLQTHRAIYLYPSDPRNPYVYSHTSSSAVDLALRVHDLAALHADGNNMSVQILDVEQGWPLPWYLRDMPHVGYQSILPAVLDAPVIIADDHLSAGVLETLGSAPYESVMYVLRPGVTLWLFVKKDLWGKFMSTRTQTTTSQQMPAQPSLAPSPSANL